VLEAKRGMLVFTDAAYAQVGTDARAQGGGYHWPVESFIEEVVASADQSGFEKFLSKAPQQTGELSRTIRIHRLDNGQLHYIKFAFYNEAQTGESDTVIHGAMQEITQQRLREQELEEVAKRSRTRFKHSLDAILVLEEERITECNPAAVDTFGVGEAEALEGRNLLDFAPREQAGGTASTEAWRKLQAALQEKGHAVETLRLQRADGTPFEAELVAHRLARHGAPLVEMILRDLTALAGRVHQEAEAHQPALHAGLNGLSPEALQKQVAAAIGDAEIAFWAYDFQEETLQLTDAAKHLLGYAPQEVSEGSAGLYELLKPEDQPRWEAQLAAVRQGQQNVLKIALQLKQRRGGYRKLIFKGEAHWNGDTTPHRLQGVMLLATYSAPAEGST
jgi:PAS domain S-box-containing protein